MAFGRLAEFAEKYFRQGLRVSGRIQTSNYTNKDGVKVYTTQVIIEEQEFAESRAEQKQNQNIQAGPSPYGPAPDDSFMNIPPGMDDEIPFK